MATRRAPPGGLCHLVSVRTALKSRGLKRAAAANSVRVHVCARLCVTSQSLVQTACKYSRKRLLALFCQELILKGLDRKSRHRSRRVLPAGLWPQTVDFPVGVGSRDEEEASAGVQLHAARRRLPAALPAERCPVLRAVSSEGSSDRWQVGPRPRDQVLNQT